VNAGADTAHAGPDPKNLFPSLLVTDFQKNLFVFQACRFVTAKNARISRTVKRILKNY